MVSQFGSFRSRPRPAATSARSLVLTAGLLVVGACSSPSVNTAPTPQSDPRVGLKPGLFDAAEASWNLKVVSSTKPPEKFVGSTNSDLAFTGNYAIQEIGRASCRERV